MKKIMFNDRFGLTDAVIDGTKTMTRRIVPKKTIKEAYVYVQKIQGCGLDMLDYFLEHSAYKVNEIVAVAQPLMNMGYDPKDTELRSGAIWGLDHTAAWKNKMFVFADECLHQIQITDVYVQHIQSISETDCFREGIMEYASCCECGSEQYSVPGAKDAYYSPKEAFSTLIKSMAGEKAWDDNPYVYVYSFKLVK